MFANSLEMRNNAVDCKRVVRTMSNRCEPSRIDKLLYKLVVEWQIVNKSVSGVKLFIVVFYLCVTSGLALAQASEELSCYDSAFQNKASHLDSAAIPTNKRIDAFQLKANSFLNPTR
jgi:hypothetical protein